MSEIKKRDDKWEQLMVLRAATATTGIIAEAQRLQLDLWGQLAFQHVASKDISFVVGIQDFDDGPEKPKRRLRLVEYTIKSTSPKASNLLAMMGGLSRSIKALLGPEYTVSVVENGKPIFLDKGTAHFEERRARPNGRKRKRKRK